MKLKPTKIIVMAVIALLLGTSDPVQAAPYMSSGYYCLMDAGNGQLILSKNADQPRPVASTTKMLTAIVALEYASLDEVAVVSQHADHTLEYTIGLKEGQQITVNELLKAALVRSANDAAVVLAEHAAGDERFFAYLMNKKAFLLGASQTHFENASGLPAQEHLSTAYDLALIGRYALSNPDIARLVAARQVQFRHPGYQQPWTLSNTNTLLDYYPGANGVKTGTTNAAGKCLVASARQKGRQLIAVSLHSGDRAADCARLLDYGFKQTRPVLLISQHDSFKEIPVTRGNRLIPVNTDRDIKLWMGEDSPNIEKKVQLDYQIVPPVQKGTRVGELSIYADGKPVETAALLVGQDIDTGESRAESWLKNFLQKLKESAH